MYIHILSVYPYTIIYCISPLYLTYTIPPFISTAAAAVVRGSIRRLRELADI